MKRWILLTAFAALATTGCATGFRGVGWEGVHPAAEGPEDKPVIGLQKNQELWIVERPDASQEIQDTELPSAGELLLRRDQGDPTRLRMTDLQVTADIHTWVASVHYQQHFKNPSRTPADFEYRFPLLGDATVTDFVLTLGDRSIRAIVKPRAQALRTYKAAKKAGYSVTLIRLDQDRVFRHNFANLPPNQEIVVTLSYAQSVEYDGQRCQLTIPVPKDQLIPKGRIVTSMNGVPTEDTVEVYPVATRLSTADGNIRRVSPLSGRTLSRDFTLSWSEKAETSRIIAHQSGTERYFAVWLPESDEPVGDRIRLIDSPGTLQFPSNDPGSRSDQLLIARIVDYEPEEPTVLQIDRGVTQIPSEQHPTAIPALPTLWAQRKLVDLYSRTAAENPAVDEEILDLALRFNLLCSHTAFVVVDATQRNAGGNAQQVPDPQAEPENLHSHQ